MLKVSVVIPVYNGERFIGEAIQSVLDQTFRDFEIIVVDDGSTDRTQEIVGRFSGPISYHRQENKGAAQARNFGVTVSNGEWIAFLDADDLWYPEKLEVQIGHVDVYPDIGFFYSDMDVIDEDGRLAQKGFLSEKLRRRRKERKNLVFLVFKGRPFAYPSTVLVRKNVFLRAGGFNPNFGGKYLEDLELFARIARIAFMYFIPHGLVKYRVCKTQGMKDASSLDENWPILLSCLLEMSEDEAEKQSIMRAFLIDYARHLTNKGKRYFRGGDYQEARRYFRLALSTRPFNWKNLCRFLLSYLPSCRELYIHRKTRKASP